ncbi:hypothetical protein [Modicisalibacter radicis]|uniref:hypothetical protein n=1 Tax=Halomonas sp. EAR18 TaxID=2518972 RepID=UPI001444929B|nr:hypothetical protein [Halomonas sp. EAR18]
MSQDMAALIGLLVGLLAGLGGRPVWHWGRRILDRRPRYLVRLGVRRRRTAGKDISEQ